MKLCHDRAGPWDTERHQQVGLGAHTANQISTIEYQHAKVPESHKVSTNIPMMAGVGGLLAGCLKPQEASRSILWLV